MSYVFDRTDLDEYLSVTSAAMPDLSGDWTIVGWAKPNGGQSANQTLLRSYDDTDGNSTNTRIEGTTAEMNLAVEYGGTTYTNYNNPGEVFIDGSWNMIVGRFDSTGEVLGVCINGDTANEGTTGSVSATPDGSGTGAYSFASFESGTGGAFYQGKLAHWGVYEARLSDAEIATLWNSGGGSDLRSVQSSAMLHYWPLVSGLSPVIGSATLTAFNGTTLDAADNPFTLDSAPGIDVILATVPGVTH